jgi:hypothetical protein
MLLADPDWWQNSQVLAPCTVLGATAESSVRGSAGAVAPFVAFSVAVQNKQLLFFERAVDAGEKGPQKPDICLDLILRIRASDGIC